MNATKSTSPLLSATHVTVIKDNKHILDDISLQINQAEIITLIGPNGSGKTSLIKALLGLSQINSGSIYRKDDVTIAYVPQLLDTDPTMPLTVMSLMHIENTSSSLILEKLDRTGAKHLANNQVSLLSGGELRRVLLARAMLRNADLLVLDEPSAGLDFSGQAQLYELLTTIRDETQCGILLVSHDLHLVMAATDKVVCLNHHICCEGKPSDINQHPEYLRLFSGRNSESVSVYNHHHNHEHGLDGHVCDH
jgi:zinc transport system ATP-binding protein